METKDEKFEWYVLNENEMKEITGGEYYYIWIDGKLVLVEE